MDKVQLINEFYQCIRDALIEFSKTPNNQNIYAMALDCDSSVGDTWLRFRNRAQFNEHIPEYKKYFEKWGEGWEVYGLHGSEYSVGDFEFIDYNKTKLVKHFTDSYYYYSSGDDYWGEDEPIEDIEENYEDIFWEMVRETINRLKNEMSELNINIEDDFIFFYCDHDQSDEELDAMISETVDKSLMEKLIRPCTIE